MTTPFEHGLELGAEQHDPAMRRLLADLDRACITVPPSPSQRAAIDGAVYSRLALAGRSGRKGRMAASARRRLVSLVAVVALALGGLAGYLHLQSPTPASAQTILRRAVAAMARVGSGPDRVLHEITRVRYGPNDVAGALCEGCHNLIDASGPLSVELWTQLTATSAISQQVATARDSTGALAFRIVQAGRTAQLYDARDNVVETMPVKGVGLAWGLNLSLDTVFGMNDLQPLVRAATTGSVANVHLLPPQSLDGVPVNVVQIDGRGPRPRRVLLYIDAQDYTVRGEDVLETTPQGTVQTDLSVRVTARDIIPLAAVPAGAFTLGAPADARAISVPVQPSALSAAQAVARPDLPAPCSRAIQTGYA